MVEKKTEKVMNIATKRGFFYPSAEIYGAAAGFWTYGHLGTLLKHKWENTWRDYFLGLSDDYFEVDDCNILPVGVFKASGHLDHFTDPLVECDKCHFRFRADQLIEDELKITVEGLNEAALKKLIDDNKLGCPKCGSKDLSDVRFFNMMFSLKVGATGEEVMYLRPETAQSPYLAFKREYSALREKIPFGLAVIGKAFRNEISPRQGFFRLREFTQAELQIFFNPDKVDEAENWNEVKNYKLRLFLVANRKSEKVEEISCHDANAKLNLPKFYAYHLAKVQQFYLDVLKFPKDKFRFRELSEKERAFYNKIHFDIEADLETLGGFKEIAGLHYRADHDLNGHQEGSKEKLSVLAEDGKRFIPHVLELSFGVDRNIWALMDLFYNEDKERNYYTFPSIITPFDVAVFPLLRKDNLPEYAAKVYKLLKEEGFKVFYDEKGSIGKMYRRMDEIGCPAMITVDHQSLNDDTVTLRDRDTMKQVRVSIKGIQEAVTKFLGGEKLSSLGKEVK